MTTAALIVAAGRGTRVSASAGDPKQYVTIGGKTVLARAIEAFATLSCIDRVRVVIHPDDHSIYRAVIETLRPEAAAKVLPPARGGATRQASVLMGLRSFAGDEPRLVLIHDAARPFVARPAIEGVVSALQSHAGAIAAVPLADTLKRAGAGDIITATVERAGLWRAQTPQGFHFDVILRAHEDAHSAGVTDLTDDAAVAERAGVAVALVPGGDRNVKLTTAEDIAMARSLLKRDRPQPMETCIGNGFDVHRFAPGSSVWLCGIEIPHTERLDGHSDADVGLHALTDALLGAIGAGDIGTHFPPSDMRWKGAASHIFLKHAADLVAERGGRVVNADVTILAEAPRVGPHREAMCARMAEILGIAASRVSVKATTTEQLGFTGRREGIAAMAVASVELPQQSSTSRD